MEDSLWHQSREDAERCMIKTNSFAVIWTPVDKVNGKSFRVCENSNTVLNIMKQSQERDQILHFHEALFSISKIFFDIDLVVPNALMQNTDVQDFCSVQLSDNGDDYASMHNKYFKTQFEQYLVYQIQDAVAEVYSTEFADEFTRRSFTYNQPLSQRIPVDKQLYMRQLDQLFDSYRNSRPKNNDQFKISWHLVFCPNDFCMLRDEQQHFARIVNIKLQERIQPLINTLKCCQLNTDLSKMIDPQVYVGSNMRLFGSCKESVLREDKVRKQAVIFDGQYVRSQKLIFRQEQGIQIPHRLMISCTTRTDGTALAQLTSSNYTHIDRKMNLESITSDLPISFNQLQHALSKININDCQIWETSLVCPVTECYLIKFANRGGECPLCKRVHDSDNMFAYIRMKSECISVYCYRYNSQNQRKAIQINLQGDRYISEFDIGQGFFNQDDTELLTDLDRSKVANCDDVSITKVIKSDYINRIIAQYGDNYPLNTHLVQNLHSQSVEQQEVQSFAQLQSYKRIYIKSHMGTGKTKQLFKYIEQYAQKNPEHHVVIVTFRVTFAQDMVAKLNNSVSQKFQCYTDIKKHTIECKYLIVQIESLNRLRIQGVKFGLLILDESESIYEQLSSGLSPKEVANMNTFKALMRFSQQVIAMDAYMQDRTLEMTERFATNTPADQDLDYSKQRPAFILLNSWQRVKNYVMYKGSGKKNLWMHDIIQAVAKGENIVIPCTNASIAKAIYDILIQQFNSKASLIQLFTQDRNEAQRAEDLKDVQNTWNRYQVLIYSPTISAGISFEGVHYNRLFAYFEVGVTSLETFFQMMGRVRNIDTGCRHILIAGLSQPRPQTIQAIEQEFIIDRNNACAPPILERMQFDFDQDQNVIIVKTDDFRVTVYNILMQNLSTQKPFQRFYWLAGVQGRFFIRKSVPDVQFSVCLDSVANTIRQQEFLSICNSPIIDLASKQQLLTQVQTEQNKLSIRKFNLLSEMGLSLESQKQREFADQIIKSMTNERQTHIWSLKNTYLQLRKQHKSVRFINQHTKVALDNTKYTKKSDLHFEFSQWMTVLEQILSAVGLNQDILDYERFPKKCNHKSCQCIIQTKDVFEFMLQSLIQDQNAFNTLKYTIQNIGIDTHKLSKPNQTVDTVFKTLNRILQMHYKLTIRTKVVDGDKIYVVNHLDGFEEYIKSLDELKRPEKAYIHQNHNEIQSKIQELEQNGLSKYKALKFTYDYNYCGDINAIKQDCQ